MLASKAKMCTDGREYDEFAYYLAYDVFDKIERPRHEEYPMKSVLNYIKSIIKWRIMGFRDMTRQRIYDPLYNKRWGDGTLKNNIIERMETSKKVLTVEETKALLSEFPKVIYGNIPSKFNNINKKYIYMSASLTIIKLLTNGSKKLSVFDSPYNIVMYKLDGSYENIVRIVINKSLLTLADEIKGVIDKFKVGDLEYDILMNSVFGGSDKNEEYYTLN